MPFHTILSTRPDSPQALGELATEAAAHPAPDLAVLFYSPHHRDAVMTVGPALRQQLRAGVLLGVPGETVVANEREVENAPALALWLGKWAGKVTATPFHLDIEQTGDGYTLLGWPDELVEADPAKSLILCLADPFTFPVDTFLQQLNDEKPGLPVVGGMASGADEPGQNVLIVQDELAPTGAVAVLLQGDVRFRTVVSQGCRPIGKPLVVTRARDNMLLELGGKPPMEQLQAIWLTLKPRDHELVQRGLFLGRAMSEYRDQFGRGDFLIRNILGMDQDSGAIAVADNVRVGQTVQFHVRDAATADEDLHALLRQAGKAAGGLLFSCNGRGTRLFDGPDHDAKCVQHLAGPLPLAGFFAQGELGPVGKQNFIHGFTASVVLFDE